MKRLFLTFIGAGGLLMILAANNILPAVWLANLVSTGDQVSETFRSILQRQQYHLGLSVLIGGLVLWTFNRPAFHQIGKKLYPGAMKWAPGSIAAASFTACLLVQYFLFENIPHVTDATCHYFQGKIFSGGRLTADAPPCPDAFYQHNMIITSDGHWFSRYPPGTALLIALGWLANAPWLILPIIHVISVLAFHALANRFVAPCIAILAAALYGFSPMVLLLGASYMSHTPFMAFAMLGLALFLKEPDNETDRSFKARWIWVSGGFFTGATLLFRPQDTLLVAIMAVICAFWSGKTGLHLLKARMGWAITGGLISALLFAGYNHLAHGNALSTGYGFGHEKALHQGIRVSLGFTDHFSFSSALRNTINVGYKFNSALFGWPLSVLFIFAPLFITRHKRISLACISGIIWVAGFFFFYSYPAYEFEARFWILLVPFCAVLTALGIHHFFSRQQLRVWVTGLLITFSAYALIDYWPHHIWPTYGTRYEEATRAYYNAAQSFTREHPGDKYLFLIAPADGNDFNFSSGFIFNDPGLTNRLIFSRYQPDSLVCLAESFPDRKRAIIHTKSNPFSITIEPLP